MDELPELQDPDLLWSVIKPVMDQYNPSDRCVGSLCMNLICQIMVGYEIGREDFLAQSAKCYDIHFARAVGRKNDG